MEYSEMISPRSYPLGNFNISSHGTFNALPILRHNPHLDDQRCEPDSGRHYYRCGHMVRTRQSACNSNCLNPLFGAKARPQRCIFCWRRESEHVLCAIVMATHAPLMGLSAEADHDTGAESAEDEIHHWVNRDVRRAVAPSVWRAYELQGPLGFATSVLRRVEREEEEYEEACEAAMRRRFEQELELEEALEAETPYSPGFSPGTGAMYSPNWDPATMSRPFSPADPEDPGNSVISNLDLSPEDYNSMTNVSHAFSVWVGTPERAATLEIVRQELRALREEVEALEEREGLRAEAVGPRRTHSSHGENLRIDPDFANAAWLNQPMAQSPGTLGSAPMDLGTPNSAGNNVAGNIISFNSTGSAANAHDTSAHQTGESVVLPHCSRSTNILAISPHASPTAVSFPPSVIDSLSLNAVVAFCEARFRDALARFSRVELGRVQSPRVSITNGALREAELEDETVLEGMASSRFFSEFLFALAADDWEEGEVEDFIGGRDTPSPWGEFVPLSAGGRGPGGRGP